MYKKKIIGIALIAAMVSSMAAVWYRWCNDRLGRKS